MAKGATERGGRTDTRQRRAFQRLGQDPFSTLGIEAGSGIVLDSALGKISIDLASDPGLAFSSDNLTVIVGNGLELTATGIEIDLAANSGLAFSSGDLIVIVGAGLELTASGIEIDLLASSGLAFSSGDLTIDLRDTTPALELTVNGVGVIVGNGLELTASGVEIDLAANSGLAFSGGDLIVTVGAGLELTVTGVEIDLAIDPGLEFTSGDIRVKVKAAGGITRDSDGLSQTQVSDSGVYNPTVTAIVNIAGVTSGIALWTRQGNIVTVYARVTIEPINANTATDISFSLPVAPFVNFGGIRQASGIGNAVKPPNDGVSGICSSITAAVLVRFHYVPTITGEIVHEFDVVFRYTLGES